MRKQRHSHSMILCVRKTISAVCMCTHVCMVVFVVHQIQNKSFYVLYLDVHVDICGENQSWNEMNWIHLLNTTHRTQHTEHNLNVLVFISFSRLGFRLLFRPQPQIPLESLLSNTIFYKAHILIWSISEFSMHIVQYWHQLLI